MKGRIVRWFRKDRLPDTMMAAWNAVWIPPPSKHSRRTGASISHDAPSSTTWLTAVSNLSVRPPNDRLIDPSIARVCTEAESAYVSKHECGRPVSNRKGATLAPYISANQFPTRARGSEIPPLLSRERAPRAAARSTGRGTVYGVASGLESLLSSHARRKKRARAGYIRRESHEAMKEGIGVCLP